MARAMRTEELRETLNVQVSAAAVVVDKGEAAKKLNEVLSRDSGRKRETPPPGANQIVASGRKLTAAQQAEIAASMAATKTLRE